MEAASGGATDRTDEATRHLPHLARHVAGAEDHLRNDSEELRACSPEQVLYAEYVRAGRPARKTALRTASSAQQELVAISGTSCSRRPSGRVGPPGAASRTGRPARRGSAV